MTSSERQAIIDLHLALDAYVRACVICSASGRLRSGRRCPACARAREALDKSAPLLERRDQTTLSAVVPENQRARDGHGSETRWICYLLEASKGLRLNAGMIKTLAAAYGEQTEGWLGKVVRLYRDPTVEFAGRVVGGLRIQTPRAAAAAATHSAFAPSAFSTSAAAAPPATAPFDPYTGEIRPVTSAPAAADPEFDDDIPF